MPSKEVRIPVRVVVQHDEHLAGEVGVAVVVPAVLGRLDAVTDEHDLGVFDRGLLGLHAAVGDELVPESEVDAVAAARTEGPGFGHGCVDADDVERLLPASIRRGGFEAHVGHHVGYVLPRHDVAGGTRATSLHRVVGEVGNPGGELGRGIGSGLAAGGEAKNEKRKRECGSSFGHRGIVAWRDSGSPLRGIAPMPARRPAHPVWTD